MDPSLLLLPFVTRRDCGRLIATFASGDSADLDTLLVDLIRRARRATYPRKSMAASLRQGHATFTAAEREAVLDMAIGRMSAGEIHHPGEEWMSVAQAARALEVPVREIQAMLGSAEGRRRLGWPWRVASAWRIPAAAIRSHTRARYMADLPERDPYSTDEV